VKLPQATLVRDGAARIAERSKVVLVNDDFTTEKFVVELLHRVFDHPLDQAARIMAIVDDQGRVAVGDYPTRKARRLAAKATRRAEKAGYPLLVTIEPCD
jgi:ATP-dependent Clp protease adaptor protein ClpS